MKKLIIALCLTGGLLLAADVTVSIEQADVNTVAVMMENTVDVAGFQFNIVADDQFAASGFTDMSIGSAADAGFMVSTNDSGLILGFSLTGATIPAGSGTLVTLSWNINDVEGYVDLDVTNFAGIGGGALSYEVGSPFLDNDEITPVTYSLSNNFPNPFNPVTTITYSVENAGPVQITIYNLLGKEVKTLVSEYQMPGNNYSVVWNGTNDAGSAVASGIYYYKMVSGNFIETKKMVLQK
ncbi:MAG: T9SS type A sorting domain-containing protein [FCB group bacterium]|nr:T9SS type A sorting domain-containing protein [FCB group bacterium]